MENIYESTLLVVDDNEELLKMVRGILKKEGFMHVDTVCRVKEAKDYFRKKWPDFIVLDVNLPDGDGFSLMQEIRRAREVPVLFLSARDEDCDRLLGLGLGADDYMTKPFLPKELVLRICAVLKRTYRILDERKQEEGKLRLGACEVDFGSAAVIWKERSKCILPDEALRMTEEGFETALTAKELAICRKLWENRGNIVTFDQLCQTVWEDNYFGYENTIMVHMRRLREKVEENPSKPKWLLTVRGLGYKMAKE